MIYVYTLYMFTYYNIHVIINIMYDAMSYLYDIYTRTILAKASRGALHTTPTILDPHDVPLDPDDLDHLPVEVQTPIKRSTKQAVCYIINTYTYHAGISKPY